MCSFRMSVPPSMTAAGWKRKGADTSAGGDTHHLQDAWLHPGPDDSEAGCWAHVHYRHNRARQARRCANRYGHPQRYAPTSDGYVPVPDLRPHVGFPDPLDRQYRRLVTFRVPVPAAVRDGLDARASCCHRNRSHEWQVRNPHTIGTHSHLASRIQVVSVSDPRLRRVVDLRTGARPTSRWLRTPVARVLC